MKKYLFASLAAIFIVSVFPASTQATISSYQQLPVIADGVVNISDLNLFNLCWNGKGVVSPVPSNCLRADVNKDGRLDDGDFQIIKNCLGAEVLKDKPECARADIVSGMGANNGNTVMSPIQIENPKEGVGISKEEERTIKETKELIIAPTEGYKNVIIDPAVQKIVIKDGGKEIIAPKEGFKTVVWVSYGPGKDKEIIVQSGSDKTIIAVGASTKKEEITAETKEAIEIKENKIYLNQKEVRIMPDTASDKALAELGGKVTLELKDSNKELANPFYEAKAEKQVKVLWFFPTTMETKTEIDAKTGMALQTRKPWWSFLTF